MPRRRLLQFLLEVAFLAGLAALAVVARMAPGAVIAVMAFGWVVVALVEWASWLDRPHFGRGLPPRYYQPQVSLPPPQPLPRAPLVTRSPRGPGEEAKTWIASPGWVEELGEWPAVDLERLGAELGAAAAVAAAAETEIAGPAAGEELDWTQALLPIAGEDASAAAVARGSAAAELTENRPAAKQPPAEQHPAEQPPAEEQTAEELLTLAGAPDQAGRLARHRVDPFAPSAGGRLRRRQEQAGVVELPDGPPPRRRPPLWLGSGPGGGAS